MSDSGASKTGYDVTGGGTNAPWNWGVSQFDQGAIDAATSDNATAITNRYNQLGLGTTGGQGGSTNTTPTTSTVNPTSGSSGQTVPSVGASSGMSTMELQDLGQNTLGGEAMTGQEQTQNVGQAALNPALQPQLNDLIGASSSGSGSKGGLFSGVGSAIGGLL